MLARMTPGEFSERYAAHRIDPGADTWEVVAAICATILNVNRGDDSDPVDIDDLMPGQVARRAMSADAAERWARSQYGE